MYYLKVTDWKRVALTKVYDELYLEVPFERIKYEYEQAPWRVYPFRGIRYGYKKVYHRHFKPKYIHRWKELAEAKVDDILIPKPYVRDSEVSRHRTKLSTHRTWKRFRKTQYK